MKTLYLDCQSGISGDMFLGALCDLGMDQAVFQAEMEKLRLGHEIKISFVKTQKNGIAASKAVVEVETHHHHEAHHGHHHHHGRNMKDIRELIEQSGISETAKKTAIAVFEAIARAEAKVHGSTPEDVHFHEVGAADSIADIVGTAVGLELLGVEQIVSSPLSEGRGMITCQHGLIPVPAPATLELCMQAGIPLVQTEEEGEMVTPTGAGLVAALAEKVSSIPALKNARIGYGAGEKEFKRPNVLRAVLGDLEESEGPILVLETNIDDSTPEQLGYVMERLLTAGAKDTYFTPVYMKKNRPGVVLTVLCDAELEETMEHIVFTETTTIGVRKRTMERCALPREAKEVETKYGTIRVKVAWYKGQVKIAPEYEDCALLARKNGVPLSTVYAEAMANAREL